MYTYLDKFHQGGKYYAQIASHQAELRREEKFTDQKYLFISSLQTDYLNLGSSSGCGKNSERANLVQKNCTFCGGANHSAEKYFQNIRKEKEKSCVDGDLDNKHTECTPRNFSDVDLKITLFQNFRSHRKKMINEKSKYKLVSQ